MRAPPSRPPSRSSPRVPVPAARGRRRRVRFRARTAALCLARFVPVPLVDACGDGARSELAAGGCLSISCRPGLSPARAAPAEQFIRNRRRGSALGPLEQSRPGLSGRPPESPASSGSLSSQDRPATSCSCPWSDHSLRASKSALLDLGFLLERI